MMILRAGKEETNPTLELDTKRVRVGSQSLYVDLRNPSKRETTLENYYEAVKILRRLETLLLEEWGLIRSERMKIVNE